MEEKPVVTKHRPKMVNNGLGGAENTPNSQMEQLTSTSSMDVPGPSNPTKRKLSEEAPPQRAVKVVRKEKEIKSQDLVDRIWLEIDNQQREKREKQAIRKAAQDAMRATSHEPPHEPYCLELNAANLRALKHDDSLARKFIEREEMVDKLLGYKMLLGRMENYTTLGYVKMRDNNDDSPRARAQRDGVYGREPVFTPPQPPPLHHHQHRRGPRTPPDEEEPMVKRGPRTPPGSPGPSTPPPLPPMTIEGERHQLLVHMAQVTGASIGQVEMICGEALNRAIENNNCDKLEVLESFKTALISMAANRTRSTTPTRGGRIMCSLSDQMELVSDATLSDSESFSPCLPPPPPPFTPLAAPPIPPTILSVTPQQPPPPIHHHQHHQQQFSLPPMSMPPPMAMMPPPPTTTTFQPPPMHLPPPPIMPPMSMPPPMIMGGGGGAPPPPPPSTMMMMQKPPPPVTPQMVATPTPTTTTRPRVELKSIVDVEPEQLPTVRVIPTWMTPSPVAKYPPPPPPSQHQPPAPPPPPPPPSGFVAGNVQSTLFSALGIGSDPSSIPTTPTTTTSSIQKRYGNNHNVINNNNHGGFKKVTPQLPPPRFFF